MFSERQHEGSRNCDIQSDWRDTLWAPMGFFAGALLLECLSLAAARFIANGFILCVAGLALGIHLVATIWGALGPGRPLVRIPVSLSLAVFNCAFAVIGETLSSQHQVYQDQGVLDAVAPALAPILLTPLALLSSQLPLWLAVYLRHWRIVHGWDLELNRVVRPQISIRGIMAAMFLVGLAVVAGRLGLYIDHRGSVSSAPPSMLPLLVISFGFAVLGAAAALPLTWAFFPPAITRRRVAVASISAVAAQAAYLGLQLSVGNMRDYLSQTSTWRHVLETVVLAMAPLAVLQLTCLLGVRSFRMAGYRLVGRGQTLKSAPADLEAERGEIL